MTQAEREARTRTPLPTRDQIVSIDSLDALEVLREDIERASSQIEVDLEYRSEGDDDWERRARGALTAHRACLKQVNHRISFLARSKKAPRPSNEEAKLQKAVKHADRAEAVARQREAANEKQREATERARLQAQMQQDAQLASVEKERERTRRHLADRMERLNWATQFVTVASEKMDRGAFMEVLSEAQERATAALQREFEA